VLGQQAGPRILVRRFGRPTPVSPPIEAVDPGRCGAVSVVQGLAHVLDLDRRSTASLGLGETGDTPILAVNLLNGLKSSRIAQRKGWPSVIG
jgi:hypothetical protein